MRTIVPLAALALAALALAGPAAAELHQGSPEPIGAPLSLSVVVRQDGGFAGVHRWLWYDADGTVRAKGLAVTEPGTFRARAEIGRVEQIVDDLELCTKPAPELRPAGGIVNDAFYYKVSVRCPHGWRFFTSSDGSPGGADVRTAIHAFEKLGANLKWEPTDERIALPDPGNSLYHTAGATKNR
ncbi:MAG TPA: hypothetical protein VII82_07820 [Polyangiaceae bacterium]